MVAFLTVEVHKTLARGHVARIHATIPIGRARLVRAQVDLVLALLSVIILGTFANITIDKLVRRFDQSEIVVARAVVETRMLRARHDVLLTRLAGEILLARAHKRLIASVHAVAVIRTVDDAIGEVVVAGE